MNKPKSTKGTKTAQETAQKADDQTVISKLMGEEIDLVQVEQLDNNLTAEQEKGVKEILKELNSYKEDIDVSSFGTQVDQASANTATSVLRTVRTSSAGEVGSVITNLIADLRGFTPENRKKGIFGLLQKAHAQVDKIINQFDNLDSNVNKVVKNLESHRLSLKNDLTVYAGIDRDLEGYCISARLYVIAGKRFIKEQERTTLTELYSIASRTGLQEDARRAKDFKDKLERLARRLHDMITMRVVNEQTRQEIDLQEENNNLLVDKIHTLITQTIPAWRNAMTIALGIQHARDAVKAVTAITDATNEMLKRNADNMKSTVIDITRQANRPVIDIETVAHINETLISAMKEVEVINTDAKKSRAEGEIRLEQFSKELKDAILEFARPEATT